MSKYTNIYIRGLIQTFGTFYFCRDAGRSEITRRIRCLQHATYQNEPIIKDSSYIFTLTKFNGI